MEFNIKEGNEYVYLMMAEYKDKTLLRVGYTRAFSREVDLYELYNPGVQVLKVREGTRGLRDYLNKKFEKYAYSGGWFYYAEEIIEGFDILREENFLNVDRLKDKIYNTLRSEFKGRAGEFLSRGVRSFIYSLDYSEIPFEIDPTLNYKILIPSPISNETLLIDLGGDGDEVYFQVVDRGITERADIKFRERVNRKIEKTNILLGIFERSTDEERFMLFGRYLEHRDDYVRVDDGVPSFDHSLLESDLGVLKEYKERLEPYIYEKEKEIEDRREGEA